MWDFFFSCGKRILSCSMWDLVPWPGIEPRTPALGAQSLSHWTTREVPYRVFLITKRRDMQEGRRKYPGMSALELIHIYYFGWGLSLFVVLLVLTFYSSFRITANMSRRQRVPIDPRSTHFPHFNMPHTVMHLKPTLTHLITQSPSFTPEFTWCCTFYGFGQVYNDMDSPLQYHRVVSLLKIPKNPLCSNY